MFSQKFSNLISDNPQSAEAISRVADYFARAEADDANIAKLKLDTSRLREITKAGDSSLLAELAALFVSKKIFKRVISLESPTGGGIAEFRSFDEIPTSIRDFKQDVVIDVTPALIKVFYIPDLRND